MRIDKLTVKNIRSHTQCAVELTHTVTLITGRNGSGKTSLLEAIYISLRGRSFKDADDALLNHTSDWYRIDLTTSDGDRSTVYDTRTERKKKTHTIDGKAFLRLPERVKYPIVLFEPEDLLMITGSPSRRRRYLDTIIAQYTPHYSRVLQRYERALLQRNKLLKRPGHSRDELFAWDITLSRYGAEIITLRQELSTQLSATLTKTYQTIADVTDSIELHYSKVQPVSSQQLLIELEYAYERDRLTGTTTVGPHRHDIEIVFNKRTANETGSRGELRTITLALKFIEAAIITERTGKQPIILLDDVFSELDETRQRCLLGEFHDNQVIMTSTNTVPLSGISTVVTLL